jgi:alkanesulfonate monooxygenase SsuD/methylene tetrahydromethanopterin reductase-like flavin-dependent oxidoreductase (luciferase family)
MTIQLDMGLHTFGDVTADVDGVLLPHAVVIRNLIDQAVLADEVGVDFIGVGEHHRGDFAVSAPEIVLAAIASRTKRIRLGSATTVLSTDDPIRVFERFATLDAASNGRAEVILGRGSFTESFGLFGFPLDQYGELFDEKLDLFAALLKQQPTHLAGAIAPTVDQPRRLSAGRARPTQDMDRGRWQCGIRSPRCTLRPPLDACHHRRRSGAILALHRSAFPRLPDTGQAAATGRHAFTRICRGNR